MQTCHGDRNKYFIVGEGVVDVRESASVSLASAASACPHAHAVTAAAQPVANTNQELKYKFGWILGKSKVTYPSPEQMIERFVKLGGCMNDPKACHNQPDGPEPSDSNIPSGYTYLGQFLAHEITFDREPSATPDNYRSPEIDLDCLYGAGPEKDPHLYQDHARLKIDSTRPIDNLKKGFQNDLPRERTDPQKLGRALIVDPRNDENLVVSQTHVAFIRFHNSIVDSLVGAGFPKVELFARAREEVVKYFQWIILEDYLPRIVGKDVVGRVRNEPLECFRFGTGDELFIPLEFSVAAFRIGHSMVRDKYHWNSYNHIVGVNDLFEQTRFSGKLTGLTSDWVIDWRHFYDFRDFPVYPAAAVNNAKSFDTVFSLHIETIADYPHKEADMALRAITVRNLVRGFELELPTGQEMAEHLGVPALGAEELRNGRQKHLLDDPIFEGRTPLWYYILREAELQTGVSHLGPVGGRIVAGTLVEIIRHSRYSILRDSDWSPKLGRPAGGDVPLRFEMTDLLHFADVVSPIGTYQKYA